MNQDLLFECAAPCNNIGCLASSADRWLGWSIRTSVEHDSTGKVMTVSLNILDGVAAVMYSYNVQSPARSAEFYIYP